jgi:hypothetical protein
VNAIVKKCARAANVHLTGKSAITTVGSSLPSNTIL